MTSPASSLGITGLGQIAINVHDLPRAITFYRDVLGLPLLFTAGSMAFFDCGGVRLLLGTPDRPELDHPSSILYFRVSEIQSGYQYLLAKNVAIEAPPRLIAKMPSYDLWMAAFRDSEGNILELMSEAARAA